jgi:hypothetical protein
MKKIVLLLLLFAGSVFAQSSVNDYKYVVVNARYSFQSKKDQYRLNTLTKLLLEKYGFTAFLDSDDMPEEVANYNCNKLYADVESEGNFLKTKLIIVLKDCKDNIIFTSGEGTSKDKDWGRAYNEALRGAFDSFAKLNYKYNQKVATSPTAAKQVSAAAVVSEPVAVGGMLYAQPIDNGYQLIDNTPKAVMKIFRTSAKDTYIAIRGTVQGVLVSKDAQWFFEYYDKDKLISEKMAVKF